MLQKLALLPPAAQGLHTNAPFFLGVPSGQTRPCLTAMHGPSLPMQHNICVTHGANQAFIDVVLTLGVCGVCARLWCDVGVLCDVRE